MTIVDVVNLGDKDPKVITIGLSLLTLGILLCYRGEYCWLMFSCRRRAQQRRDME